MNAATLINQTSGDVEYYTDPKILAAAREVMGRIGLDPASSEIANKRVQADAWFGINDNSLQRAWCDEVWMNHPFGRPEEACTSTCTKVLTNPKHKHHSFELFGNAAWINKLMEEWRLKNISQACCITYACTSEAWFQPLLHHIQCFLCPRTNYYLPDGTIKKGVTKGSVVTYLGPNAETFRKVFSQFGVVK